MRIVDLSGAIEEGQPVYPGWPKTRIWVSDTHEEVGLQWADSVEEETEIIERSLQFYRAGDDEEHPINRTIQMSEHGPTHVDSFNHLDPANDTSVDEIPLERFYTDGIALDLSHKSSDEFIEVEDIEAQLEEHDLEIREGDTVLFHTGHRQENYGIDDVDKRRAYMFDHTGLSGEAGWFLHDHGVGNFGIDAPTVEHASAASTKEYPVHDMCAEHEILHMENLENIDEVVGERFQFAAFPLRIKDGTGSPLRPVAIFED
ncbi:cyclase family protein [Halorarius halobius]|uniref:cyclase family protein n=1 Tax=Halorarius halobius TaxID=2962671 RepID=UPI0020CCD0D6|nr:cyclase family protein [Halorarius halobius]